MRTAYKLLTAAALVLAMPGCCSWCGQGTTACRTTAPAWGACPTTNVTVPTTAMSRPVLPQTATMAGAMVPPQVALR